MADENDGASTMDPHSLDTDGRPEECDAVALIKDLREISRRQTRTFMWTLVAVSLLHMTSTVVSHVWS